MLKCIVKFMRFFFPDRGEVLLNDESFRRYKKEDNSWRLDV